MRVRLSDLKSLIVEASSSELMDGGFVHLSQTDLGPTFTFTPRRPTEPFRDINQDFIEDPITKRTSWALSIRGALDALTGMYAFHQPLYVYWTDVLPGEVDLEDEFDEYPSSPKNKYGVGFELDKWEDYVHDMTGTEPTEDDVNAELNNCVPDSKDTHERWALDPVEAHRVGYYMSGEFHRSDEVPVSKIKRRDRYLLTRPW